MPEKYWVESWGSFLLHERSSIHSMSIRVFPIMGPCSLSSREDTDLAYGLFPWAGIQERFSKRGGDKACLKTVNKADLKTSNHFSSRSVEWLYGKEVNA